MPHRLLNGPDVVARFQQVGHETVQLMGGVARLAISISGRGRDSTPLPRRGGVGTSHNA